MTNTINNVPRELLADLLGNDHDKRIMAERHLLAMLANAPAAPAADAWMVAIEWAKDAEEWGPALNEAGWLFLSELNEDPQKSALIFNSTKGPLRAAIMKYAEIVTAHRAQQVSVPTWMASSRAFADRLYMAGWRDHADAQHSGAAGMYDELLAAAQAAPAADAGLVDPAAWLWAWLMTYCKSRGLAPATQGHLFESVSDMRAALAAHRAKGVV